MVTLNSRHVIEIYLSGKGRIGRGEFWAYGVALTVVLALVLVGGHFAPSPFSEILALAVVVATVWGYGALLIKRGHDRGRPGWFSILVFLARLAIEVAGGLIEASTPLMLVQVAVAFYIFVDYALMPGVSGTNRYGPPAIGLNKNPLVLGGEPTLDAALPGGTPKA